MYFSSEKGMLMDLQEQFDKIGRGGCFLTQDYGPTHADTIKDFWNQFILPRLPDRDFVIAWHKLLLDYVHRDGAVYAIRAFNDKDPQIIRRGFYTKVNNGDYSFFYTDNSFAHFFAKIMVDKDCLPTTDELYDFFVQRKIPYKFSIGGHTEDKYGQQFDPPCVYANAFPRSTKGMKTGKKYKLAHVYPDGKDYSLYGEVVGVGDMTGRYFRRENHDRWQQEDGIYVRRLSITGENDIDMSKKWIKAHFLRFIHPMNYFLAPKGPSRNGFFNVYIPCNGLYPNDIGEYEPLLNFIKSKLSDYYQVDGHNYYQEFLNEILPVDMPLANAEGSEVINLTYSSRPLNVPDVEAPQEANGGRAARRHHVPADVEDNLKVERRIASWATNSNSKVHKIIKSFVAESHDGRALVNDVRLRCSNPENADFYLDGFNACLASLKTNAGNSYGKLFVEEDGHLSIFEEVKELFDGVRDLFE